MNVRPNLVPFLERVSKVFEVVVFTSSFRYYADPILNHIDRDRKLIHHRLYRQHCIPYDNNIYLKDLRILGRDLRNVLIVDNAPYSFAAQISNGYPIIPFYDHKNDRELLRLEEYLTTLESVEDITAVNREKFGLHEIAEEDATKYAKYSQDTDETRYLALSPACNDDVQSQVNGLYREEEPSVD